MRDNHGTYGKFPSCWRNGVPPSTKRALFCLANLCFVVMLVFIGLSEPHVMVRLYLVVRWNGVDYIWLWSFLRTHSRLKTTLLSNEIKPLHHLHWKMQPKKIHNTYIKGNMFVHFVASRLNVNSKLHFAIHTQMQPLCPLRVCFGSLDDILAKFKWFVWYCPKVFVEEIRVKMKCQCKAGLAVWEPLCHDCFANVGLTKPCLISYLMLLLFLWQMISLFNLVF